MTSALEAALTDCRRDAIQPVGSIEQIAARHGVDPFDLCAAWLDDPSRAFCVALRNNQAAAFSGLEHRNVAHTVSV